MVVGEEHQQWQPLVPLGTKNWYQIHRLGLFKSLLLLLLMLPNQYKNSFRVFYAVVGVLHQQLLYIQNLSLWLLMKNTNNGNQLYRDARLSVRQYAKPNNCTYNY